MTTSTQTELATLTGDYTIDPMHSYVGFLVGHAMITRVRGSFADYEGSGHFDGESVGNTRLELTVRPASVDTGVADRDGHLQAPDFFDTATYPEMRFVSTSAAPRGDDGISVTGDLTLKGVTRPVTIDFTIGGGAQDPYGLDRLGLRGTATLDRRDWGLEFNAPLKTGGVLVGNTITLELEVSAVKAAG